jgi:CRP-like cAMP-binding protein
METLRQSTIRNKLLAILPAQDFARVAPDLEHVSLPQGTCLNKAGEPIDYIYFLISGIGSIVAETPEGNRTEAGIFGFEGYVPTSAVAEVEISPTDINVQIEADAYRMSYEDFRRAMEENRSFSRVIIRCIEAFTVQLSYTVVSNAIHEVPVRLARWLLMCHDRVQGNDISLTHEFLALMLAVRRPSVTTSLHILEGDGFVKTERGNIIVRNRAGLEEFARDAYGKPEAEYRRLMKDLF